jgi:predicted acylesterase/phospholipase RssA
MKKIRHLVISSGGVDGIITYGAVKSLINKKYFKIDEIETIHAVSAGALISVMLLLGYSTEDMDDYIVKRPWHRVIKEEDINLTDLLGRKGLIDSKYILETIRSLFEASDIMMMKEFDKITLSEFEKLVKTRIYMYTVNVNVYPMNVTELSAESYPDMPLAMALQMTCCIPMLFTPVFYEGGCYVDGGLVTKCPTQYAIERNGIDELLVFYCDTTIKNRKINKDTTTTEYAYHLINIMNHSMVRVFDRCNEVPLCVRCFNADMRNIVDLWYDCIHSEKKRREYVYNGERFAEMFMKELI